MQLPAEVFMASHYTTAAQGMKRQLAQGMKRKLGKVLVALHHSKNTSWAYT